MLLGLAGPVAAQDVVIASKNFPESHLLGEIMKVLLEETTDLEVVHESGLGGTLICWEALRAGEIDLYADYTGTAWSIILKETERVSDPMQAYLGVQSRFRERYAVEWLAPFGLNNTYAIAMNEPLAAELGVRSISDLRAHGASLRAGFSIEFVKREDGWAGLSPFYDLELAEVRAMEHSLAYEAVAAEALDLVDAYTTDGKLLRYDLRLLEDDRGFFPPYHAAPLVRAETLERLPELRPALEQLAFRLGNERIVALNYRVEVEGHDFTAVARDFLEEEGLLAPSEDTAPATSRKASFPAFLLSRWAVTLRLLGQHLVLTVVAVALAAAFAVPLGVWILRRPLAERISVGTAGVIQTLPSIALLAVAITIPGLGLSMRSAIVALFLYAVLPILRNTHAGLSSVDPDLIDAARGVGLTERQVLRHVRFPLAIGTIMAGLRTSTVFSIGVATLAAFIGAGGLGEPIVEGLYLNDRNLVLAGALPAAALALVADWLLGRLERRLRPRGLEERT